MFKLNKQQFAEFAEVSARGFTERMVQRVAGKLGVGAVPLSGDELKDRVKQAVARAVVHHITAEKDVRRFVDLTLALGERFDDDPALPWAGELLDKASPRSAGAIVDQLCERAAEQEPAAAPTERPSNPEGPPTDRARVGDPVERCPPKARRRLYMFSS